MLLKSGDSGVIVTYLQYGLHIMCCTPNGFDGVFGAGTEAAVIKYQQNTGLSADGIVGDGTWNNLCSEISIIQRALASKGYYSGSIDGVAGEATYNAVVSFQSANSLAADGQVGSATRVKLMRAGSEEVSDDAFPLSTGSSGDNVIYLQYGLHILCCSPGGIDGVFGSGTESAVKKFQQKYSLAVTGSVTTTMWNTMKSLISEIQQALVNQGYSVGVVDGVAGPATYEQVMAFQSANGLIADGQVGPSTSAALLGTSTGGTVSTDAFPLSVGSSGPYVLYVQYALYINCINPNGVDGTFGNGTKTAVEKFQSQNGLTANGIVDTETWEALREIILPIQQALTNRGYDTGGVDGIAGEKTYNAIIAFQQANGLSADGQVGSMTMAALQGESTGGGTVSSTLQKGSSGSLTRYLQRMLNVLGYSVPVDGIFGTSTHNAIISFQNAHGLDADGIVGGGTWGQLFASYNVPVGGSGVEKMVNVAQHELSWGFAEDNANNITPYGQWYGMNYAAWCAMFVSWCANQAGIMGSVVPQFAYCPYGVSWYMERGRFYSRSGGYTPKVGDTIFFFSSSANEVSHTGIVVGVTNSTVTTIEGNSGDCVCSHVYNRTNTYIHGYGNNGGVSSVDPDPDPTPEEPPTDEEEEAFVRKFRDLIEALGHHCDYGIETKMYVTQPLFTSANLTITCKFGKEDTLFNQSDSPIMLDIADGQLVFNHTNINDYLSSTLSASVSTEMLNKISALAYEVDTGKIKIGVYYWPASNTLVFSYAITGTTQVNELHSVTYSLEYEATYTNVTSSGGDPAEAAELLDSLAQAGNFIKVVVAIVFSGYLAVNAGSIAGAISKVFEVTRILLSPT